MTISLFLGIVGGFRDEIVPVVIPGKHGKPDLIIEMDGHPC